MEDLILYIILFLGTMALNWDIIFDKGESIISSKDNT